MDRTRIVTALVVLASAVPIRYLVVEPWNANIVKKSVEQNIARVVASTDATRTAPICRDNIAALDRAEKALPADVELYAFEAANYRLLRQYSAAEQNYRHALSLQERPELYIYLAETLVLSNRSAEAIEAYAEAVRFDRAHLRELLGSPLYHDVEQRAASARQLNSPR